MATRCLLTARSRVSTARFLKWCCWWRWWFLCFCRILRASIIPIITISVSLIGTFALMALAIGRVADDATMMLEKIFRHIKESLNPFLADTKRAREIGFVIITMTATLVAVYAPLAFTLGLIGWLLVEFTLHAGGCRGWRRA